MASSSLKQVIETVRAVTLPHEGADLTDGQLLESYIRSREEAAFSALVRRHGSMVWGVCRRILRSRHDAEDAFQAVFLILVRKAASVAPRDMVANWLYGVAQKTALYTRASTARRRRREQQVTTMPESALPQQERCDDLEALLDQEMSRLPDKYRAVIVLCDLEGKTRKEAARHFHLPEGTVATRLATARTMLARRLARHGLATSVAALATALAPNAASANVPASVASSTIEAASLFAAGQAATAGVISVKAVALTEGVLKTMLLSKLKIVTAVLLALAVFGAGAIALTQRVRADKSAGQAVKETPAPEEKPAVPPGKTKPAPAVQPVKANDEKNSETHVAQVGGCEGAQVKAVDVEKGVLVFDDKAPTAVAGKAFRVAPDALIQIDGKRGTLAELPAGAFVNLGLSVDRTTIRGLDAQGPQVSDCAGSQVKGVDNENRTLTFDDKARVEVAGKTFPVAVDAFILIDGKRGKLAELPAGAFVNLTFCVDRKTIRHLDAQGHQVSDCAGSPVKAVDAANSTITFDDKARVEVAGKTFRVAPDALIQIDGKRSKLDELSGGAFVNLTFCVDRKTIRFLDAQGHQISDCNGSQVKAVDAANNTISFDDKVRAELAGKTFRVAPDAFILIDGKPGKLTGLPAGAFVNLTFSVDRKTIRHISAQGPPVLCDCGGSLVKAVDVQQGRITFDDKARAEVAGKTYLVAKDANILIDGKRAKLAELPVGAYVSLALSVDGQTALHVNAQGPSLLCDLGGSVVKAVDARKGTITFDDKARADVAGKTFTVAGNANILIDGKLGKLAELPPGSVVSGRLQVDHKTVSAIHAKAP